jgi:hypothetical protein
MHKRVTISQNGSSSSSSNIGEKAMQSNVIGALNKF